jgi:hypothetical protein
MGTLRSVWSRLKPLLLAAMQSEPGAGAKADPKKSAALVKQFMAQFASVMTELEAIYKVKAQVDARFKKTSDDGLKLLQPFLQQVDAAHKLGFNPDNSQHSNMDDRLGEMIDRLKELKSYGCQVQWD